MSIPTALEPELQESRKRHEESFHSPECIDTISVFNRVIDFSPDVLDSFKTLFSYRQLPENWDSYGSPPPTDDAINSAQFILYQTSSTKGTEVPYLRPLSGAGIQISWRGENRELELAILKDGKVDFLQCEDDDVVEERQAVPLIQILSELEAYIDWITGSAS